MNRKIKFRAWDKTNKQMFCSDDGRGFQFELSPVAGNGIRDLKGNDIDCEWSDWMQFTGLHDKNGVEIYEGDIIRFENINYEIRFFKKWGMFGLVGKSSYKDFIEEDPLGSGGSSTKYKPYVLGEYYQKRIEVIGNIYQNKDLLKK